MMVHHLSENELLKKQFSELEFELNQDICERAINLSNGSSLIFVTLDNDKTLTPGDVGLFLFWVSNAHSDKLCFIEHINARVIRNNPNRGDYEKNSLLIYLLTLDFIIFPWHALN